MSEVSKAAQVRAEVQRLSDEGRSSEEIGRALNIAPDRVDHILDLIESQHLASLPPVQVPVRNPAGPKAPAPAVAKQPRLAAPCGTKTAYQRHYQRGEKPCQPCKDAYNAYQRAKTAARKPSSRKAAQARPAEASPPPVQEVVRPKERIRWLVPRGITTDAGLTLQYAVSMPGGFLPVTAMTAEIYAQQGRAVFARYVSAWVDAR